MESERVKKTLEQHRFAIGLLHMIGVVKFLPILVSGVKDWALEGAVRLLSPLRRTGTMRKELREAEFGKHN